MFLGLEFPQFTRYPLYCVGFEEGNGPHQLFLGGQYRANPSGGYGIRAGTGGAGISVGDLIINGVHFVIGSAGVRLDGPSDDKYRRSEEHTSELQSLMRISYAVFCLKKKKQEHNIKMNIDNE